MNRSGIERVKQAIRIGLLATTLLSPMAMSEGRFGGFLGAGNGEGITNAEGEDGGYQVANVMSGPFDGASPKTHKLWIDDTVFLMHPTMKVIGGPTKLGLLSAIQRGEIVEISVQFDETGATLPVVTEIRRLQ
ncbi:MAG: hypothetical protein DIZ78_16595 [endosymbiont of Escarpia spicata]|uniref:Uncharacterized protein n=1 Tax=endosymbiont of Escarpia spicata TaxID=2200908 RepID=A0A370DAX8_9GAMM|nr:MAG: hypothetical protein DIZ78_16595 [endosymbiont of Escarpia spicata]